MTDRFFTRRAWLNCAAAGGLALGAAPLWAQQTAYPSQNLKFVVPYAAGGATDVLARMVGQKLTEAWNTPVVVENKPGAGGRIALETLKAAPADGSVLAVAQVSALANYPHIYSKMNYTDKDFAPVSIAAIMHHGLAVGPMVPASVKTVKDFLAWAKANPKDAS